MQLQSYAAGKWRSGTGDAAALRDATTGEVIAHASAEGLDAAAMLVWAREVGGPNLRRLTFHERAALLKTDLSDEDQVRLLDISHQLTAAFRRRLAERAAPVTPIYGGDPDAVLIRNNRRVRPPRPQSS